MAKASYSCPGCGDWITVRAASRRAAGSLAIWREKQGHVCDSCLDKKRQAESAESAEWARDAGLPALHGSPKQVSWAERLRHHFMTVVEDALPHLLEGTLPPDSQRDMLWHMARIGVDSVVTLLDLLHEETDAEWWIDHRTMTSALDAMADKIAAARRQDAMAAGTRQERAEDEALQILKPASPVSSLLADISWNNGTLRVTYPERREDVRLALRDLGYVWNKPAWVRRLSLLSGSQSDRMAETAHRLLGLGIMVKLRDADAREKALSGTFSAEQRRWCTVLEDRNQQQWIALFWPKSDDYWPEARRLPGMKTIHGHLSLPGGQQISGGISLPPEAVEEAVEFAEAHEFGVTEGVRELLDQHRRMLASGAVIDPVRRSADPVRLIDSGVPRRLIPPEHAEIAPDLRDD